MNAKLLKNHKRNSTRCNYSHRVELLADQNDIRACLLTKKYAGGPLTSRIQVGSYTLELDREAVVQLAERLTQLVSDPRLTVN